MKKILLGLLIVAALSACSSSEEKATPESVSKTVESNAATIAELQSETVELQSQLEAAKDDATSVVEHKKMIVAFEGTGAKVDKVEGGLHLSLPADLAFKSGKSELNDKFKSLLGSVSGTLTNYPDATATIKGHTDTTGSDEFNQKLSEDRARSVSEYLVLKGIDPSRIETVGVGSSEPVEDNDTKEGKAANRRVDITVSY